MTRALALATLVLALAACRPAPLTYTEEPGFTAYCREHPGRATCP